MIISISIDAESPPSSHPPCLLMLVWRQIAGMAAERILLGGSLICIMGKHWLPPRPSNLDKDEVVAPLIDLMGEGVVGWSDITLLHKCAT